MSEESRQQASAPIAVPGTSPGGSGLQGGTSRATPSPPQSSLSSPASVGGSPSSSYTSSRSPAVKRILQELKEMEREGSSEYAAAPVETDLFEWLFAVRGPQGSEFEGGIYLGRIQLPPEYPFKPPSFSLITPNGRFEINTKICLSISNYHPEQWQPSWSVRTALVALIAFMPTPGNGAVGSLDYKPEERRRLAKKTCEGPPNLGESEKNAVAKMLYETLARQTVEPSSASPGCTQERKVKSKADDSSSLVEEGEESHEKNHEKEVTMQTQEKKEEKEFNEKEKEEEEEEEEEEEADDTAAGQTANTKNEPEQAHSRHITPSKSRKSIKKKDHLDQLLTMAIWAVATALIGMLIRRWLDI